MEKKHPGGRPIKWTKKRKKELLKLLLAYIEDTDIPIIAEFAYLNNIARPWLYEMPELSDALKKAVAKKESNLERFALTNKCNVTMAIFSLKQLGWRDNQSLSLDGAVGVKIIDDLPAEPSADLGEL